MSGTKDVEQPSDLTDELTAYIINYYPHLMTDREKLAHRASFAEEKAENLPPGNLQRTLRERWGSTDPDVLAMLKEGREVFLKNVAQRILRERSDELFFNHCPRCGALAKTPRAKQCAKCFHSWHDAA
jgi:uncharacterized C2H2 Zn-finger protein